jgi:hypothetical protein
VQQAACFFNRIQHEPKLLRDEGGRQQLAHCIFNAPSIQ